MKALISALFCLFIFSLHGQQMEIGFDYLENGDYKEALDYFETILVDYPDNKTARLCYGRALGLSGKTIKAKEHFTTLLQEYPDNTEIRLNYAESLLWNKDYGEALPVYENLVLRHPENFAAVLGFANTLSQLQQFDAALLQIQNAMKLEPENNNAKISLKYIRIGKAANLIQNENYEGALKLLAENLEMFPGDPDSQLTRIDCYLRVNDLNAAAAGYRALNDSISTWVGLSLIAHKRKDNKEALLLAEKAKRMIQEDTDSIKKIAALERWVQALLWNRKFIQATKELSRLEKTNGDHPKVLGLRASFEMYTGDMNKSRQVYERMLSVDSTSFDGNLGIANAYFGRGDLTKSLHYARQTLKYYPNQKDAIGLINKIEDILSPITTGRISFSRDNGRNEAYTITAGGEIPISKKLTAGVAYTYRSTQNMLSNEMAYTTLAQLRLRYRLFNNTTLMGNMNLIATDAANSDYQDINGGISLSTRPLPLLYLNLGYNRELQSFNAALLNEKIFMDNFSINHNLGTNFGLGWYNSYTFTSQTDGNIRNLLFTSLYFNLSQSPLWKAGLNYQYMGFKKQLPQLYFSPSKYQAWELFSEVSVVKGNWIYGLQGAAGIQYVESDTPTSLFRFEGNIDHNISSRLQFGVFGKYSTIASETATGFEFMEVGIKLRWQFKNAPLFKLR